MILSLFQTKKKSGMGKQALVPPKDSKINGALWLPSSSIGLCKQNKIEYILGQFTNILSGKRNSTLELN